MDIFGLLDAENVSVAVLHYSAPAIVLLYFIFASSVPDAVAGRESEQETSPLVRRPQTEPSNLLKWVWVLTILTFVCVLLRFD
jgi:hypothetical protein